MSITLTVHLTLTIETGASTVDSSPTVRVEAHASSPSPSPAQESEQADPEIEATIEEEAVDAAPPAATEETAGVVEKHSAPTKRAIITQEFLEARRRDRQRPASEIGREIALRHNWSVTSVTAQIYTLKLNQQNVEPEPQPAQEPVSSLSAQPASYTAEVLSLSDIYEADPQPLAKGNIAWDVRADGLPQTWQLDYLHGNFPYPARSLVVFSHKLYRLGRVWRNALDVTSVEADQYEIQE